MDVLGLSLTAGLLAGLAHAIVALVTRHASGRFSFFPHEVLWMAPVGNLMVFAPLGVVLAVVAGSFRGKWVERATTFAPLLLATIAILNLLPRIDYRASLVLAAGVAISLVRALEAPGSSLRRSIPRVGAIVAAVALVGGVGQRALDSTRYARGLATLPAARPQAPNILLIVLDAVRAQSLSLHGYSRNTTPELRRLADSSVVFDRAMAPASWTLPSHASMFTGERVLSLPTDWTVPLPDEYTTIGEVLRDNGYATGAFVANLNYTTRESGLGQGILRFGDHRVSWRQVALTSTLAQTFAAQVMRNAIRSRSPGMLARALFTLKLFPLGRYPEAEPKSATMVTAEFLDWQRSLGPRPFFAFLNIYDAHRPYDSPPGFKHMFGDTTRMLNRYDGAIRYVDQEVSRLLDSLAARGQLDNTVVIVTSDHGELFGEHRAWEHGGNLYMPVIHIPLLVRYPRALPAGLRVPHPVTATDLAATIVEFAGDSAQRMKGRSLSCYWGPTPPPPQAALAEVRGIGIPGFSNDRRPTRSLVSDRWHFLQKTDGSELLFDYLADPAEENNLAGDPGSRDIVARFGQTLAAGDLTTTGCPR